MLELSLQPTQIDVANPLDEQNVGYELVHFEQVILDEVEFLRLHEFLVGGEILLIHILVENLHKGPLPLLESLLIRGREG